jgi:hypothetical protein
VLTLTLETTPADATVWSTRSLARHLGMSQSAISRIWRAVGLKPHLVDTFKLSTDPQFIDKVHDVVGLYLNPPQAALVLCVDEKTQVQALDRTAPVLPVLPGVPQRATHDDVRSWFLACARMRARPVGPAQSSALHYFARSGPTKEAHRQAFY